MRTIISKKKIFLLLGILSVWLLFFQSAAWSVQNSLELHSGTVKIIRSGKSQILQKAGETYTLLENDRLQTGGNTQVTLYLKDGDNTVKLFSHSFFKLDDLSEEENSVALLTGKGNFSVKVLAEPSGRAEELSENTEKKKVPENKLQAKLGGNLKGSLAKLVKTKLRRKKERFKVRTVLALVGVRGTEFVIGTGLDSGKNVTNVAILPEFGNHMLNLEMNRKYLGFEEGPKVELGVNMVSQLKGGRGWTNPVFKTPAEMIKFAQADGTEIFQGVEFGPSESVAAIRERLQRDDETQDFAEEADAEGELLDQLDRLEELESLIENAENSIDAAKSKTLILSMTITNR